MAEWIAKGALGPPILSRLSLVLAIHEEINSKLVAGNSVATAEVCIRNVRDLFALADKEHIGLDIESISAAYIRWADSLMNRVLVKKDLKNSSAYSRARQVGSVLDRVLERTSPILHLTRLRRGKTANRGASGQGITGEKKSQKDLFEFGYLVQDVCDGLSVNAILNSSFPFRINRRAGAMPVVWSQFFGDARTRSNAASFENRVPLINLRIEAELFFFISQTSMNLSDAVGLKRRHFFYVSHLDGYHVKDRKERRAGEVLFEIFKEYKPHFERYLSWLSKAVPTALSLFPFITDGGRPLRKVSVSRIKTICGRAGVQYFPPSILRSSRTNWMLRKTGDPDLTAELAQHAKETLLEVYERPSQQRAVNELIRYWSKADPTSDLFESVAPGLCRGVPERSGRAPDTATQPDCQHASGCLWCFDHRDIESFDHVWALASLRHLKTIEISKWPIPKRSTEPHPAQIAIDHLTEKLRFFEESNETRKEWVCESLLRIEEGSYHSNWERLIKSAEGVV